VGVTNPAKAAPGTIRGDLGIEIGRNLIHASDEQPGSAEREVALWFGQGGLLDWSRDSDRWIRE
jgi:nucleoside-diphosphate kinase